MELKNLVITKTPHRICLTGGTDFLPFVKKHSGAVFSAAIDKFVTIIASRRNDGQIKLHYPDGCETVKEVSSIQHPIIRQALTDHNWEGGLELVSFSDVPSGAGLGSSGAFTVGLVNTLHALRGNVKTPSELGEEAADIEINKLKAPIGKHDQYLAAHGGFCHLVFNQDNSVTVNKLKLDPKLKKDLEERLVLVFSGIKRSASKVLSATINQLETGAMFAEMNDFKSIGNELRALLISGRLEEFAAGLPKLLAAKKRTFANSITPALGKFIEVGYQSGAVGAKITGAGGGGFVYFYVPEKNRKEFEKGITHAGGTIFPYSFTEEGSKVIAAFE